MEIHTVPIGPIYKSVSRDSLVRNAQTKHRLMLEPHGSSIYTLSMNLTHIHQHNSHIYQPNCIYQPIVYYIYLYR